MFRTDWPGVLVLAVMAAIAVVGVWLVVRSVPAVPPLKRRPSIPQLGAADGTGVEPDVRGITGHAAAALPRSPQSPAGGASWTPDPQRSPAGPDLPAGTVDAPHAVPAGRHRRRVVFHG